MAVLCLILCSQASLIAEEEVNGILKAKSYSMQMEAVFEAS